ncbi:Peptidase M14, carboxypeptidase A [Niveomyces insectorum RCEF 264]|uniref:Inactive metallocarboxypeptidase ECM14 n=1 Tax=Niveomyces insectorum RCEF 264 TaxID=1081102 RepID=A0A167PSP9_9HYPO|nr:Peptidase M14, carboxypeptidase A [Niveomyces insectorum RCEF 264]
MRLWSLHLVAVPLFALLFFAVPALTSTVYAGREARRDYYDDGGAAWSSPFPLIKRLRDSAVELVFGRHPSSSSSSRDRDAARRHPAQWHNAAHSPRYAKQTVIRFTVMTADEEAALAEAAERLFLDVWSFNNHTGTVDIRLDKEDVPSLLSLLPITLHRSFTPLVSDLATAVRDTFPKTGAGAAAVAAAPPRGATDPLLSRTGTLLDTSLEPGKVAVLGSGSDGGNDATDNVFFRDYQPYPVIVQWMKLLDAMFPIVDLITVGETAEGRDIVGLRVGAAPRDGDGDADDDDGDDDVGEEDDDVDDMNTGKKKKKKKKNHKKGKRHRKDKKKPKPQPEPTPPKPERPQPATRRKTIVITGGLHAREWISTSSVSYVAWAFVSGYGKVRPITRLLDTFDVVFLPVVNPDGYAYTWETDRLWRKTRQRTNFRYCRGFDLDHAFGYAWDAEARPEPCAATYGGEAAFQAVEAQALAAWARDQVAAHGVDFVGLLDLHAYAQQILFPYAHSCAADAPNRETLEELAAGLAKAIRRSTGEVYSIAPACAGVMGPASSDADVGADDGDGDGDANNSRRSSESTARRRIEPGGGSALDWFYHELQAKYSYQIKLRDTGSYGFLLPSAEIVPTGKEVLSAVHYFGDFLLGNNGIEKSVGSSDGSDGSTGSDSVSDDTTESDKPRLTDEEAGLVEDDQHSIELRRRRRR